jgi:hypothetical protein
MTTLAELAYQVRDGLKDFPKQRIDKANGDGATKLFDFGKDMAIIQNSVAIQGLVAGVDYAVDYDANQLTFTVAPAVGVKNVVVSYKEAINRDEKIFAAVNSGRRMLWMRHYQTGTATITTRNLVRQYDLRSTDVNEAAMRTVFTGGQYRILRAEYRPQGASDELMVPFQAYELNRPYIHLWRMLPVGYTLRLSVIYDFTPLVLASDVTDVPDGLHDLIVWWALGTLALKKETERDRHDTANVLQGVNALPPGLQAQTSEDFVKRWMLARNTIAAPPPVFVEQRRPRPWQV